MTLLDSMIHECTISLMTHQRDDTDLGDKMTPRELKTEVPCEVQNAKTDEILEYQKRDMTVTDRVFFNTDEALAPGHRIEITSGPSKVGKVYKVKDWTDRSAGRGILYRAMCEIER